MDGACGGTVYVHADMQKWSFQKSFIQNGEHIEYWCFSRVFRDRLLSLLVPLSGSLSIRHYL